MGVVSFVVVVVPFVVAVVRMIAAPPGPPVITVCIGTLATRMVRTALRPMLPLSARSSKPVRVGWSRGRPVALSDRRRLVLGMHRVPRLLWRIILGLGMRAVTLGVVRRLWLFVPVAVVSSHLVMNGSGMDAPDQRAIRRYSRRW